MSSNNDKNESKKIVIDVEARLKELEEQSRIRKHQEGMRKVVEAAGTREYQERMIKAAEKNVANTAKTNEQLLEIIDNQKKDNKMLRDQLEVSQSQLQILKNLFVSLEDGVSVEKELASIIRNKIDETHPLWDYVKDKGGDIAVGGAITPILYYAIKEFFRLHGVLLP